MRGDQPASGGEGGATSPLGGSDGALEPPLDNPNTTQCHHYRNRLVSHPCTGGDTNVTGTCDGGCEGATGALEGGWEVDNRAKMDYNWMGPDHDPIAIDTNLAEIDFDDYKKSNHDE